MAEAVYMLCAITGLACVVLLLLGYRRSRIRLLLWSALCFAGLTINSALVCIDLMLLPSVDLRVWRAAAALTGMLLLVYGLVWETGNGREAQR